MFILKFIKNVVLSIYNHFNEKIAENNWTRISGRLGHIEKVREKNLPITFENATLHRDLLSESQSLYIEAKKNRKHPTLKYAYKGLDNTFEKCIQKTKDQILFAEKDIPAGYIKPPIERKYREYSWRR